MSIALPEGPQDAVLQKEQIITSATLVVLSQVQTVVLRFSGVDLDRVGREVGLCFALGLQLGQARKSGTFDLASPSDEAVGLGGSSAALKRWEVNKTGSHSQGGETWTSSGCVCSGEAHILMKMTPDR